MAYFKLNACWTCDYRVYAVTKPSKKEEEEEKNKTKQKYNYKVALLEEYTCVFLVA